MLPPYQKSDGEKHTTVFVNDEFYREINAFQ